MGQGCSDDLSAAFTPGCGLGGVPASGCTQVNRVSCARFSSAASSNEVRYEKCLELSGELPREPREKVRSYLALSFFGGSDTYWKKGFYNLEDPGKSQRPLVDYKTFSFPFMLVLSKSLPV